VLVLVLVEVRVVLEQVQVWLYQQVQNIQLLLGQAGPAGTTQLVDMVQTPHLALLLRLVVAVAVVVAVEQDLMVALVVVALGEDLVV
jgi:hypothetical protein